MQDRDLSFLPCAIMVWTSCHGYCMQNRSFPHLHVWFSQNKLILSNLTFDCFVVFPPPKSFSNGLENICMMHLVEWLRLEGMTGPQNLVWLFVMKMCIPEAQAPRKTLLKTKKENAEEDDLRILRCLQCMRYAIMLFTSTLLVPCQIFIKNSITNYQMLCMSWCIHVFTFFCDIYNFVTQSSTVDTVLSDPTNKE